MGKGCYSTLFTTMKYIYELSSFVTVWKTTTHAINAYHHLSGEFESCSWWGVLDTTLCDDALVLFSGYFSFLHQLNWPPRYNWNIVESGIKHHKPQPTKYNLVLFFYLFWWEWISQSNITLKAKPMMWDINSSKTYQR